MFVLGFRLWFRRVGCLEGKGDGLRELDCNNARIQRSECFEEIEKMSGKNGKLGWEKWRESYRELSISRVQERAFTRGRDYV
jgi:hypothetical protein